ncbi:cytochrome P450 [Pholiota conissans]|uniref:Cytochrome P450 n=1 Tax=Pholiota conissans TaxID=109636 RepID=A0A9P5Z8T1_9AGAR|nr:cytochrome P450 [Pholiota conissans]
MTFLQSLSEDKSEVIIYASSAILALGAYLLYVALSTSANGSIKKLGGFPVLTAWTFFTRRYDFIWDNFSKSSDPHFKFQVLQHQVVALRGEEARQTFFDSKSLDSLEGYKILMGAAPSLDDIQVDTQAREGVSWFNKQLATLFTNKQRLTDSLPMLFDDINRRMELWGKEGRIDPFKSIYDLVFQMTTRIASCDELSKDLEAVQEIQDLYWTLEKSATPTALLLPWFPSRAKKNKENATRELFTKLYGFVELRRAAKVPTSDTIDIMIGQGLSTPEIVQFILSVVFAGVLNTGINSCWALVFLATQPEWKEKVKAEVDAMIEKHTNTTSHEPLHKRLSAVPVSVWEDEMPDIELVIRETLRLAFTGTALRRNLTDEITVSRGVIKPGEFLAYSIADAHSNPDIYSRPNDFDPDRFTAGREEDKKSTFAFLGWGAGRHPCTGMKMAKLEIKVIVAMMLAGYEFTAVDKTGRPPKTLPQPDRNDIHQARPIGEHVYLQFKRIVE